VSSVSNGLHFLTLPLVSVTRLIYTSKVMSKKFGVRVIYRKIRYMEFSSRLKLLYFLLNYLFIWSNSPQWARSSSFKRFLDHNDAPQSVGLPWTSDQLVAETST
jgi:hypothetical protein